MAPLNPIVILDSGAGGLTVFAEIKQMMPWLPMVYCADNGGFPYGPKPEQEVVTRVCNLLEKVANHYRPSLAVIACNTASTVALRVARQRFAMPVVGVVPAIKTAAALSRNRSIGLLATPGTVSRSYTNDLIRTFAADCHVIRVGSTALVHLAEAACYRQPVDPHAIENILAPFVVDHTPPDTIVLGCTHFPLVRRELSRVLPQVTWVDSGQAIARRVSSIIQAPPLAGQVDSGKPHYRAVLTGRTDPLPALWSALCAHGIQGLDILE